MYFGQIFAKICKWYPNSMELLRLSKHNNKYNLKVYRTEFVMKEFVAMSHMVEDEIRVDVSNVSI